MKILPDWLKNGYVRLMDPVADWLVRRNVHPNTITIFGTVLMVAGGVLYGTGHIMSGGWLLSVTALTDVMDGTVARKSNKSSVFGAFLDSTLDRVADGATLGGLAVFYALSSAHRSVPMIVVCLAGIIGAFMTSYTRARAEALGLDAKVGLLQRPERVVLLSAPQALFGLALNGWVLTGIISILTITAWITVVQRMMYVYDKTRPLAPADAERESEPTEYRLWARRSRRDTTARPLLKGE
ncbi:MAG TPA: CDP-alcohol phosphatidyltransferase family protein [Gemmatimonadaceae bacterium]|nr:CDP-alcohol phosphatidyltransferase family protein [Gemmatimonadaceae bacterium]